MAKKKKYYVVWVGETPGVYDNWTDCQLQIAGYPGARYKSFNSKAEAEMAFGMHPDDLTKKSRPKTKQIRHSDGSGINLLALSVDAACSGNPGIMEYRGVWVRDNVELFKQGPFKGGTNNIGEFLALVHALAWLQKNGMEDIPIYSDSRTAMAWVRKKKANTTLKKTRSNAILFDLISRAETWLKSNTYKNPILKWDTEHWGEIPADFGRK